MPLGSQVKDNFNLLEYDDVATEKLGIFSTSNITSLKNKALALNIALEKWKGIKFHIICHSTGCGIGTFIAKNNIEECESLILISPWNRKDKDFTSIQKNRVNNSKNLETVMYLKSEYNLLYSAEYIHKYKVQFNNHILNKKNKSVLRNVLTKPVYHPNYFVNLFLGKPSHRPTSSSIHLQIPKHNCTNRDL